MPIIETMDALRAIPEGTQVRVAETLWHRKDEGFSQTPESYAVHLDNFAHHVANHTVRTLDGAPEPDEWWELSGTRRMYYIVGEDPAQPGFIRSLRWREGWTWQSLSLEQWQAEIRVRSNLDTAVEVTGIPAGALTSFVSFVMGERQIQDVQTARINQLVTEIAALREQHGTFPEGFVDALHTALQNFDDEDDRERTNRVLRDYDIPHVAAYNLTISVSGTITLDHEQIAAALGWGEPRWFDTEPEVEFSETIHITKHIDGDPGDDENVDWEDISHLVPVGATEQATSWTVTNYERA